MTTDDRFIEAAANTARQRDEWKARAEKAERDSRDANLEVGNQMALRDEARKERDLALAGFSKLVEASDAALVTISAERQRVTVALAAAQAHALELREALHMLMQVAQRVSSASEPRLTKYADAARVALATIKVDALSAPRDTTALRELMIKAVEEKRDRSDDAGAIVDAVLKGDGT